MRPQQAASLFWLAFSILVIYGASRLGIGTLSAPGVGFMSFGAACLLLVFSTFRLIAATITGKRQGAVTGILFQGKRWWNPVIVVMALLAYTYVLPFLGFLLGTFLLLLVLLRVAGVRQTWKVIVYALCMNLATYFVFSKCLKCQFPMGPFGF